MESKEAGGGSSSASDALWQPEGALAQVLIQRGKLLMRMGFMQAGRLYLHIEEAVYLIERNLLNLFIDTGEGRQVLSAQSARDLMASIGIGADFYAIYAHLMQASLIVRRHPAHWILMPEEDPNSIWQLSGTTGECHPLQKTEGEGTSNSQDSRAVPPSLMCRSVEANKAPENISEKGSHLQQNQRSWWPQTTECQAETSRCQVDEADGSILTPFACTPREYEELNEFPARMVLDVLAPNSRFSRTRPDPPVYHVCISQGRPPGRDVMSAVEGAVGQDIPVYFASVSGTNVSLYNLEKVSLPRIL